MPEQSADVLGRMNFESPYVDMPMRLTVRQNLTIFGRLYAVANLRERIDAARRRSRPRRLPRPRQRQALRRAEDPRGAGQGADQPARTVAAGRADRLARSRYRRLDPAASRDLSQDPRRDHPAGLAQHAGGGAAVRPRHHHEARPHRGRRQPATRSWPATTARRWRKCFSTSRAAASRRPRREPGSTVHCGASRRTASAR